MATSPIFPPFALTNPDTPSPYAVRGGRGDSSTIGPASDSVDSTLNRTDREWLDSRQTYVDKYGEDFIKYFESLDHVSINDIDSIYQDWRNSTLNTNNDSDLPSTSSDVSSSLADLQSYLNSLYSDQLSVGSWFSAYEGILKYIKDNELYSGSAAKELAETLANRYYDLMLSQYQNALSLQNWYLQQDYNSPTQQMARLSAAGLNSAFATDSSSNSASSPAGVVGSSGSGGSGTSGAATLEQSDKQFKVNTAVQGVLSAISTATGVASAANQIMTNKKNIGLSSVETYANAELHRAETQRILTLTPEEYQVMLKQQANIESQTQLNTKKSYTEWVLGQRAWKDIDYLVSQTNLVNQQASNYYDQYIKLPQSLAQINQKTSLDSARIGANATIQSSLNSLTSAREERDLQDNVLTIDNTSVLGRALGLAASISGKASTGRLSSLVADLEMSGSLSGKGEWTKTSSGSQNFVIRGSKNIASYYKAAANQILKKVRYKKLSAEDANTLSEFCDQYMQYVPSGESFNLSNKILNSIK